MAVRRGTQASSCCDAIRCIVRVAGCCAVAARPAQSARPAVQTPRAPPLPLAATLSPILWRLNSPDRFDMYSVGMLFLQMAFPPLRR